MDGRAFSILHPSQIAALLDLPLPEGEVHTPRLGWDAALILGDWIDSLSPASWEQLTKPTPARGRSLLTLTVNVFRPFEMLPGSWKEGRFDWYTGEEDTRRERTIGSRGQLEAFASEILLEWQWFMEEHGEELSRQDPLVRSNRGDAPFSVVLASQRWHAAFHHRQLVVFLGAEGLDLSDALDVGELADLELPQEVY